MDNLPLRVRFAAVARIVVCSQGASGRESPDRPAAERSRREISVSRPDFWYNNYAKARRSNSNRRGKTEFPRGRAVSPRPPPRTWDASNGSLRNFIGMTREEDTASPCSFASFDVSFRALSGASFDASEEVFVSRLFRCLPGRKPEGNEAGHPVPQGWLCRDKKGGVMKVSMAKINIVVAFLVALLICNSGVAETRCEYDADGNVTRESYFGVDGKPKADKDGVFEVRREYDNDGKKKNDTRIYAVPTREDGIVEIRREYDANGNMSKVSFFGLDGKPKADKNGVFEFRMEYDKAGKKKIVAMIYAVAGVKPTHEDGIAEERLEYDANGNVTKTSHLGLDGKPKADKNGVFEFRTEYDKAGKEKIVAMIYAVAGVKPTREDGIAEERLEYDANGNVTKMSYFGQDGKPTLCLPIGCAEIRHEYDKRGNIIRVSHFGVDGKPTAAHYKIRIDVNVFGCGLSTAVFNAIERGEKKGLEIVQGNETVEAASSEQGMLVVEIKDVAEIRTEYDNHGNRTRVSMWGIDGKPAANSLGIAEVRFEYDAQGNITRQMAFGPDGRPAQDEDGVAEIRREYDANGNLTKLLCFDVDGKPKPVEDGIEEIRYEYDSDGNLTRESYFGVDGKPKARKDGVFEVRREYDNAGNVIRGAMIYAVAGVKPTREDGIVETRYEYDADGNVTKGLYFGVDGKPVDFNEEVEGVSPSP